MAKTSLLFLIYVTMSVQQSIAQTNPQPAVTEKRLGSVGKLDVSKRDPRKPHFWVSPDGRRFAYLAEDGIVIDGQTYSYPGTYQGGVKEGTFRFSPDSRHAVYTALLDKQGETLF